jgi:hypothetical protein
MRTCLTFAMVVGCSFAALAEESHYSKAIRQACAADYHKYCGEYGGSRPRHYGPAWTRPATTSKSCVKALVAAGEVSQAEVDRRRKSGR